MLDKGGCWVQSPQGRGRQPRVRTLAEFNLKGHSVYPPLGSRSHVEGIGKFAQEKTGPGSCRGVQGGNERERKKEPKTRGPKKQGGLTRTNDKPIVSAVRETWNKRQARRRQNPVDPRKKTDSYNETHVTFIFSTRLSLKRIMTQSAPEGESAIPNGNGRREGTVCRILSPSVNPFDLGGRSGLVERKKPHAQHGRLEASQQRREREGNSGSGTCLLQEYFEN